MIGSSTLVIENGDVPAYIAIGAAAGLKRFVDEQSLAQCEQNAAKLLSDNAGLAQDSVLFNLIMDMYRMIITGASIGQLRRAADKLKAANRSNVI